MTTTKAPIRISWGTILTATILIKGLFIPSWVTAFELGLVIAFRAWCLYLSPKPVQQASEADLNGLQAQLKHVQAEVSQVKMFFGFNPGKRFSMFTQPAQSGEKP